MKINPIARAIAMQRRKYATQTVKPKKGKRSYVRNSKDTKKELKQSQQEQEDI
jgi:hypothetical protein|tara:strand:+ start:131 stop:289 length:159 start_codon:yes stop_codon:yes gene_type:complete